MAIGGFSIPEAINNILSSLNSNLPINFGDGKIYKIEVSGGVKFVINPTALRLNIVSGDYDSFLEFDNDEFVCILPSSTNEELYYSYKRKAYTSMFDKDITEESGRINIKIPRTFYNHRPSGSKSSFVSCATIVTKNGVFRNCVPVISINISSGASIPYIVTVQAIPFLFNIGNCYSAYNIAPSVSPSSFGNTLISDIQYFSSSFTYYRGDNGTRYVGNFTVSDIVSTIRESLLGNTFSNGTTLPTDIDLNAFYSLFRHIVFVNSEDEYNKAVLESYDSLMSRSEYFDGLPAPPYTPGGSTGGGSGIPSGSGGGGGTFPSDPGPSLVDQIPAGQTGNDLANSGLFTMYLMNQQYMNLIGNIMWEDNLGIQALKAVFGQPIDAIISTMSYPFNLTNFVSKVAQNLYFGPWNSGLPFQALTKSSFQINWGTINIPFGWGNFLDYAPYTKMELFLPWGPGYVPIDPNDVSPFSNTPGNFNVSTFTNGSIQVKTNIELGKGTCVHNVIGNNGRVIGSYSGVVGKQVPMTALDTGGKALTTIGAVAAVATAGASTAATAASGGFNKIVHGGLTPISGGQGMAMHAYSVLDPSAVASGFASNVGNSSAANMASRALFNTPLAYPRAGTFSDGSSAMTVQEPFLIISRPVQSVPTQYGHYNGYPSNIYVANLNAVSGYTELSEIHLDNVTATADELQELDAILKGGILL